MIYEWYFFEDCHTYCRSIFRVIAIWTHSLKTKKKQHTKVNTEPSTQAQWCLWSMFPSIVSSSTFSIDWNFIIRLRLTKYRCRIKVWQCLNLSFSFLYFRISYILFHLNIIPSNYLFKNWKQVRHSENHDMYLILIFRMFYI
jgi:hypothetical protein